MLFLRRAESFPTNSLHATWIFYHLFHDKWSYLSVWFLLLYRYSQKKKHRAGWGASCTQASAWLPSLGLHMWWEIHSPWWALCHAEQWGAGVRIQLGSSGRGALCMCILVAGARSSKAILQMLILFSHTLLLHHKEKGLPRSVCLLKWPKTSKNFPPATQYQRTKVTPLKQAFSIPKNAQCFATSFEQVCFKRCAEEGGAGTNDLSSMLEDM